jgi:DNA helicase IV
VSGTAGTGKTIIAICHAVEQAKAGDKVLFICFNKLLADWVDKEIAYRLADVNNKVKVVNFHNLLLEVVGCDIPDDNLTRFYSEELPTHFLEKLEYEPFDEVDLLIIDEGQDLFMTDYIQCLDKMVKGGLENGRWITFYDEFQNIYLREEFIEGLDMMRLFSPFMGSLETNYRNTRQIHDANHKITNIQNGRFNGIDGDEVVFVGYETHEEAKKELKSIVKTLVKQRVHFEDIIILSPYKFHHSIIDGNRHLLEGVTQIQPMQNEKGDITKLAPGTIRFSTIYSFKGMESHVVILIDINKQDEEAMRLYYTGISRAKSKLYVVYDRNKFLLR